MEEIQRNGMVSDLSSTSTGLGILGRDFVAVHAVHVSDAEQEMLAKSSTGSSALSGEQHEAGIRGSSSQ